MRLHRRFAKLFGYDLLHIKRRHPSLEAHLSVLFEQIEINLVLDVGANTGQYATLLRENGYKGNIISFEPVARNLAVLEIKAGKDPLWHICPYGLGASNQFLDINVTQLSTFSSFLTPNEYAGQLFTADTPIESIEKVEVKRLDAVYDDLCSVINEDVVVPYLKMDTQGYDLEVLKGCQNIIEEIEAFQSEISLIPLYENMPDHIEALKYFQKLGFSLTGMYQVTRDRSNQLLVEMECVMRKNA
ncbi:MAG: FkbM family methyltransferase [Desulfocapsa sp.]|nr:MAG: FkbM family methyltransferase [Desulfocapsa sp.]